MLLEYGWPDAFRREDFNRDIGQMQERWEQEARQAYQERYHAEAAASQMEELSVDG